METVPSLSDIKRAHQRIQQYILRTPVFTSDSVDEMAGTNIYFKCENFQKVGSFKMRGAANMILGFRPEERTHGFATHSSGNHAQAVARASNLAGTKSYVVMPKGSTKVKIHAVKDYGAEIVFCEANDQSRQDTCNDVVEKTGAVFVHPFDDYRIIAGQATAAKELIEEVEDLDIIMTPVGGGGLAAGTCLAAKYLDPNMEVILGEPANVDDTYRSFKKGTIQPLNAKPTIADGLRTNVGQKNFEIIKSSAKDVMTVTEEEIVDAMHTIWERMKIIIEPSCAVPLAVVLKHKDQFINKRLGIILTGGNVDLENLPFSS